MRFIERFQKWINIVSSFLIFYINLYIQRKNQFSNLAVDDPVRGLLKLYAHKQDAIKDLEQCRVNPDFNSEIRKDLEFYIP